MKKSKIKIKPIPFSRLVEHFKTLSPGEAIYCLNNQTDENLKCSQRLIKALERTPSIPLRTEFLPPLI